MMLRKPTVSFQGISACSARRGELSLRPPSPSISNCRSTASRVICLSLPAARNSSSVRLSVKSTTARAASSISHRWAGSRSSGRIDHLAVAQDMVPTERIPYCSLLHQVHVPPEDLFQLLLGLHVVEEIPLRIILKSHQHIHVAVGPEVIPERRAEDGQFLNLPSPAKLHPRLLRSLQLYAHD